MLTYGNLPNKAAVTKLLEKFSLTLRVVEPMGEIPGSYWGEPEAGLIQSEIYVRDDTPVHSLLHESCHYICMDQTRRKELNTDAGGDYEEENAVCYLQILLAEHIPGYTAGQCMNDMDEWGYSFRLGSAKRWFTEDAQDARSWLTKEGLIDENTANRYTGFTDLSLQIC